MPSAEEILRGLQTISNRAVVISIGWHVALGIAVIALLAGVRPKKRLAATMLSVPFASVAALAFAFENPFNGAGLALLAVCLAALAIGAPRDSVTFGERWAVALGGLLIAFA